MELPPRRGRGPQTIVDLIEESGRTRAATIMHFDRPLDLFPEAGYQINYGRFAEMVEEASSSLHIAGVLAGDTVAILKSNHIDVYLLACAAMRIGAVPALISCELDPPVAAELLRVLGHPVLVTDPAVIARKALQGLDLSAISRDVLVIRGDAPGARPLPEPGAIPARRVISGADEPVLITHTSGTTAVPKLAIQSHRTLYANWAMASRVSRLLRIDDTVAIYLLFAHARVVTGITGLLKMGWPLVILTSPDSAHADAVLSEHRPGVIETFPNTFILWERLTSSSSRPFGNVRLFLNTFDAMHPRTRNALLESSSRRMPVYIQQYGQTETGPITLRAYPRGAHRHAHPRCVGYPITGYSRVKVLNTAGPKATRSAGEIVVKSKSLVLGYVGRQDNYARNLNNDGWWNMTDIGYKSRWGCLHLLDRTVDETSAVQSLLALEDTLLQRLSSLTEVALIPMPDTPPVPLVCTRDDLLLDGGAWGAATADLAPLMPPVHCRWEDIPRTGTWKVRRIDARSRLQDGRLVSRT